MPITGATLSTIDKLIKIKYAPSVADQIRLQVSEFYEMVNRNKRSAGGKEYLQPIKLSLNGGAAFSSETELPQSATSLLDEFKVATKNIYGTFEISEKALAADATAERIVSLLNTQMDDLVTSLKYHIARSMEGHSSGKLCTVNAGVTASAKVTVDDTRLLEDGMIISFYTGSVSNGDARIISVDHATKTLQLDKVVTVAKGDIITNYHSLGKEFTGLEDIFSETGNLYGLDKTKYPRLIAYHKKNAGAINDMLILDAINDVEMHKGTRIDYINASFDVVTQYLEYAKQNSMNVATMDIQGGYKTMSFNGIIPIVKSRFAPSGTMDLLDTKTFSMVNLGEGGFVDREGHILHRVDNAMAYRGVYAKYSELYCNVPGGQGRISGIKASV